MRLPIAAARLVVLVGLRWRLGRENEILEERGDFLENNYKTQTISLVRKRFKLFWFLTIRVQRTRFVGSQTGQKSSPLDSVSKHRNRVQWTRFLSKKIESTELGFRSCKPSPMDSI